MKKQPAQNVPLYELKITLRGSNPAIWRRVQVPGSINLTRLHDVFQVVMGWTDSQADKTQEGFCELVIPSGDAPIALDPFEKVFYPVTTPVDRCGEWHSRSAVSASRNAGFY